MARQAKVNWWGSRNCYGCTFQGQQHKLGDGPDDRPDGPNYRAACQAFEAMSRRAPLAATLAECATLYLAWQRRENEPATADIRQRNLDRICKTFGSRAVTSLTVLEVQDWAQARRVEGWANSTLRLALSSLKACLVWGAENRLFDSSPLGRLRLPPDGSRGLEFVLTDDQVGACLAKARGPLYDLVEVLVNTGARPAEITCAEKKHFDPAISAIVYQANARPGQKKPKTHKTGRPRVIYLVGSSLRIVQRLMEENPTGPLFRSGPGRRPGPTFGVRSEWNGAAYGAALRRLARRAGIKRLTAYSFRHTYAARWLRAGESAFTLAEVLGTSLTMLRKNYGHLVDQHDYLRSMVAKMARPSTQG